MTVDTGALPASILVCPADRLSAIAKALDQPVRQVVFDLEDAVSDERKHEARTKLIHFLSEQELEPTPQLAIRVNKISTLQGIQDVMALCGAKEFAQGLSLVLPKLETTAQAATLRTLLDACDPDDRVSVQIIVESSTAIIHLAQIVDIIGERLTALVFGPGDFLRDLRIPSLTVGVVANEQIDKLLTHALQTVLLQTRAANVLFIDGPIGVFGGHEAEQQLRESARRAVRLGADAKWVIHPSQVAVVNDEFLPSLESITDARDMWRAYELGLAEGRGVVSLNDNMVDKANAEAARSFYVTWAHLLDEESTK